MRSGGLRRFKNWRSPRVGGLQPAFRAEWRNLSRDSCSQVGILRLRRSSASLHSGCAHHDGAPDGTEDGAHYFITVLNDQLLAMERLASECVVGGERAELP